jgi:hypothetical protein
MCLPVVAGIASFASSALGSIASYSQEQAAYRAQMAAFRRSEQVYNEQLRLNQEAANRGYVSEQQKLQGEFMKASQEAQQRLVTSLQAQGTVLASGRTGQSIGLLLSDAERGYGTDLANIAQNLAFARQDYATGAEGIFLNQQSANNVAASNRMLQPSKPSSIGLVTGLAGAALGGFNTFSSLKAPSAGGGGGSPKPTPVPGAQLPGGRAGTVIRWS